jgi:hypothetical protein
MSGSGSRRTSNVAVPLLVAVIALAGCGGAKAPSVASLGTTTSSRDAGKKTTTAAASTTPGRGAPASQAQLQADALKFSRCMRSHGVPNFPDPGPGGGFLFQPGSGVDPSSPAVKSAQAKCMKLMPGGGPPGPGTVTHPSALWLAQMVKAAACMRRHGYPGFPDPRTSVPSKPFGNSDAGVISDIDGVIFIFPGSIDIRSPQFLRAATVCAFPHH